MLSIAIVILLIQQFHLSFQFKTIQTVLSSTIELPCLAPTQNIQLTHSAKIIWIRDDRADIVSLDSVITVRDDRLSIVSTNNVDHQERTLRIANIAEEDHGLYRCVQGDMTLNEILLDVLIPPRIVSYSPEYMRLSVRESRSARFSCKATGNPPPIIVWHVNGLSRPGIMSTVDGKNESILSLRNISRFDSGRVDCSASNTLSTVNRQFILDVKYKPIVNVEFRTFYSRLYESVTIKCQVCALPSVIVFDIFRPKTATLIKHGLREKFYESVNQTCKQLTMTFDLNDTSIFGSYVCRARNLLGVSHAEFMLKESIQSAKQTKHRAERRSSSTISMIIINSSSILIIDNRNESIEPNMINEMIPEKSQSLKSSISISLILTSFVINHLVVH